MRTTLLVLNQSQGYSTAYEGHGRKTKNQPWGEGLDLDREQWKVRLMTLGLKTAIEERDGEERSGWVRIRMGAKSKIYGDKNCVWRDQM